MNSPSLQHEGQCIPYQVKHQKSVTRRIHLRTAEDGALVVIAPRRMPRREIHHTLQERVNKVVRFLDQARKKLTEMPRPEYVDGEEHLYLGRPYPLRIVTRSGRGGTVQFNQDLIQIECSEPSSHRIKTLLESGYRTLAADYFADAMSVWVEKATWLDGAIPEIRLRKMKRTWGSCSARGVITLNTQLIKTPPACIDYVIAHELCHTREMNHGPAFYSLQEYLYPDWRAVRSHLKERAHVYLGA